MKDSIKKIWLPLGLVVSALAFLMAQGSFAWWKQPRVPTHLKN